MAAYQAVTALKLGELWAVPIQIDSIAQSWSVLSGVGDASLVDDRHEHSVGIQLKRRLQTG